MLMSGTPILSMFHPNYIDGLYNWQKYRLTFEGGWRFIRRYLKPLSKRETPEEFALRRELSYCPAFAKAAIIEIKNAIIQRMEGGVSRKGGPLSFLDAALGFDGGVDRAGNSMNSYLARSVITELLIMGRVGIFTDMPQLFGPTIADKGGSRPYIYTYRTEQIRSWTYDAQNPDILLSVFLEDFQFAADSITGLTSAITRSYRHLWINTQQTVSYQYYNDQGEPAYDTLTLDIPRIPFVILELSSSLLADVADYQIALLNLESTDLMYVLRSNFPFYTEQYDQKAASTHLLPPGQGGQAGSEEIKVGLNSGRRYPIGAERPGFIAPPSDPLHSSMEKEEQLKRDIRALVQLSVQNLEPRRASAASKMVDERPLESGLATIGEELEHAERLVAYFWAQYEGSPTVTSIFYPEDYALKSDQEKQEEADKIEKLIPLIPSKTFQKEAAKRVVDLTLGSKISKQSLDKIYTEIDNAPGVYADPTVITKDIESGILSLKTAAKIRGYPEGEVDKAADDHSERLARIAEAQSNQSASLQNPGARGVPDLATNPGDANKEKQQLIAQGKGKGQGNNGNGQKVKD